MTYQFKRIAALILALLMMITPALAQTACIEGEIEAADDTDDALEMLMKMQEAQEQQGTTSPLTEKEAPKEEENLDILDDELAALAAAAGDVDDVNLDDELAAIYDQLSNYIIKRNNNL